MAVSNPSRLGEALDLLRCGLQPFVERALKATYKDRWLEAAFPSVPARWRTGDPSSVKWDTQSLLVVMCELWSDCFKRLLTQAERSLVSELREVRNRWAHQEPFSNDDAYRALDSASRLLSAVGADTQEVERMKDEVLRLKFEGRIEAALPVKSPVQTPPMPSLPGTPPREGERSSGAVPQALPKCDWVYFATFSKWSGTVTKEFISKHQVIVRSIHADSKNKSHQAIAYVRSLKPGHRILLVHGGKGKPYLPLCRCTVLAAKSPVRIDGHCFDVFVCIDESLDRELEQGKYVRDPVVGRFTGISVESVDDLRGFAGTVSRPLGQTTIHPWDEVFRP